MHAHRLWINLWMSLGHPEENPVRPGGNQEVNGTGLLAAHRLAARRARDHHRQCARRQGPLAAQIVVIPGIHRPYDDYQFSYARQIPVQVGKRRAGGRIAPAAALVPAPDPTR